jgi:hypothetical protein
MLMLMELDPILPEKYMVMEWDRISDGRPARGRG